MVLPTSVQAVGQFVYEVIQAAIGADTVSFAGSEIYLTDAVFDPQFNMAAPAEVTDGGLAAIAMSGNVVLTSNDPATGAYRFRFKPPVGGLVFQTTSGTGLPVTITGWVWVDSDSNVIKAGLLDEAVTLEIDGQSIEVDNAYFDLPVGGLQ